MERSSLRADRVERSSLRANRVEHSSLRDTRGAKKSFSDQRFFYQILERRPRISDPGSPRIKTVAHK